ncbi:uncharacterized protein CEXT_50591 [Caerostris extrusa]|uniref:Uncharacterized protein n=1 Tax=Caerostris extrusa TaxID=172846 RepID=A0AAV4M7F4_CAEEX|nr:uncharacterized protein CEXT_50591 [Caerostris extrusa]
MKFLVCLCVLVAVIDPCVRAKSFNFGNFFLGKAANSEPAPSITGTIGKDLGADGQGFNTEFDSILFNSSAEDDIYDFEYQNSSSDSLEAAAASEATRNESEAVIEANSETAVQPQSNESHVAPAANNESSTSASSVAATERKTASVSGGTTAPLTVSTSKETASTSPAEQEEVVVLGTATTEAADVTVTKNIFQKSFDWMKDAYTLSIMVPIAAGVLFATAIIATVAICRCLRRCCRRRRFKRKALPQAGLSIQH